MKKRLLSALLTFCMVLTMLPVSALAADPPATDGSTQIEGSYYTYDPQDHEFSPDGDEDPEVTNRSYEPNVTISKEIQATDVENQFDITLTVKTDEPLRSAPRSRTRPSYWSSTSPRRWTTVPVVDNSMGTHIGVKIKIRPSGRGEGGGQGLSG